MPGIYGLVSEKDTKNNLKNMSKSMYLYDHFIQDELFYDDCVAASRVHTGLVGTDHSPIKLNETYIWVEGEAYNISEVAKELNLKATSLPTLLLRSDETNQLHKCLNLLDGYFCAAIYDRKHQKIKLTSDRYGMRFLHWYHHEGLFAWGSEPKAILAINNVDKSLDSNSFNCFMQLGYLLDENTWFENIKLIKPATILEYDLYKDKVTQSYYWSWSEIKPSNLSFDEAVDLLGELFIQAVSRRFNPKEKIGISLSGGLDSRAIFAAVDHLYPNYSGYAYTFGIPNCDDIEIANQVTSLANSWKHQVFYFNNDNWFTPRIKKVWDTDGMQDLMHMHGSEFLTKISHNTHINLNGYAGDAILGGSLLSNLPSDTRATEENTKSFYKNFVNLTNISSHFYDIQHIEPNIYMNRVRRFTTYGSINSLSWVEQRKPFLDNQIMELVFSLPEAYRRNNKLYSKMLRNKFPKYFLDIPWQQTGKPVNEFKKPGLPTRAINKAKRELRSLLGIKSTQDYTNYSAWIRDQEVSKQLLDLLNPKNAEYTRLTSDDLSKRWLEPHLKNKNINHANQILRAATIEIYLRQVFREKNR